MSKPTNPYHFFSNGVSFIARIIREKRGRRIDRIWVTIMGIF